MQCINLQIVIGTEKIFKLQKITKKKNIFPQVNNIYLDNAHPRIIIPLYFLLDFFTARNKDHPHPKI